MSTLEYYFENGSHVIFEKYTIDTNGVIKNRKTRQVITTHKNGTYNRCSLRDNYGKPRGVLVGRALVSTFYGRPPSLQHTADHKDQNKENDTVDNLRWLCKSGQRQNRTQPKTFKTSFIIVKDNIEKNAKEWVAEMKGQKNHTGCVYTPTMINNYARNKQFGFSYKTYPELPDEIWKEITGSKNDKGRWEISNTNRVKYVTRYAENVLSGKRFGLNNAGYPIVGINDKQWKCHILSFATFFPEEYAAKNSDEIVLHENDDKMDFRPHKLRLGTLSDNSSSAHDNGCYDDAKTKREKCVSYINDILEKEHDSHHAASRYLKSLGFAKASAGNIGKALNGNGNYKSAYGRTWKKI